MCAYKEVMDSRKGSVVTAALLALLPIAQAHADACYQPELAGPPAVVSADAADFAEVVWNGRGFAVFWQRTAGELSLAEYGPDGDLVLAPRTIAGGDLGRVFWTGSSCSGC